MTEQLTHAKFIQNLVAKYSENDPQFGEKAMEQVEEYFAKMKKSASKVDPHRLNVKAVLLSRLRNALIEKAGNFEEDGQDAFNKMDVHEQAKFQERSKLNGTNKWVHDLDIIPANLEALRMTDKDMAQLQEDRLKVAKDKLRADVKEIDGDRLIDKFCPFLLDPSKHKLHEVVAGILLATGRRTVEVLKTGTLYLGDSHTKDGYKCMFDGQAKTGLQEVGPFEIPLLAPFHLVRKSLDLVRENFDATNLTSQQVNVSSVVRSLLNFTRRTAELSPHELRSCYAMMSYKLLAGKKRASMMGYIGQILGHDSVGAAAFYQCTEIVNFTGVYSPDTHVPEPVPVAAAPADEYEGWICATKPEKKRVDVLKEMMLRRLKISASAVKRAGGGNMEVTLRVLRNNADKINKYNDRLDKTLED